MEYEVEIFRRETGEIPFKFWLNGLDQVNQVRIIRRIDRLEYGNFGDSKPVGDNVHELRFFFGSGYRVYYGIKNRKLVILLCGGDKKTQNKDIEQAKNFWKEYNER
jgi:putative addiction module killer protein